MSVSLSVCLYVCVFDVPIRVVYFEAYFAPTSQSPMSKIFRDSEHLGKSAGKKWFQNWTFLLGCGLKLPRKKSFFLLLILPNKTWWKPRFPMDKRPLVKGYIANFGISLDIFKFLRFVWFFPFLKKIGFLGILGPPYCGIGATIRIGREIPYLLYAGFFWKCSQFVFKW